MMWETFDCTLIVGSLEVFNIHSFIEIWTLTHKFWFELTHSKESDFKVTLKYITKAYYWAKSTSQFRLSMQRYIPIECLFDFIQYVFIYKCCASECALIPKRTDVYEFHSNEIKQKAQYGPTVHKLCLRLGLCWRFYGWAENIWENNAMFNMWAGPLNMLQKMFHQYMWFLKMSYVGRLWINFKQINDETPASRSSVFIAGIIICWSGKVEHGRQLCFLSLWKGVIPSLVPLSVVQ